MGSLSQSSLESGRINTCVDRPDYTAMLRKTIFLVVMLLCHAARDNTRPNKFYVLPNCLEPTEISCARMGEQICVKDFAICDGVAECPLGEDEASCVDRCAPSAVPCADDHGRCIQKQWICDGEPDCLDASDEDPSTCVTEMKTKIPDISNYCGRHNMYECNSGQCILESLACDGRFHCRDHSDEDDAKCASACSTNPCPHRCLSTPKGPVCRCNDEGYALVEEDGRTFCRDVDECAEPMPSCPHLCRNTKGSFACSCLERFTMTKKWGVYGAFCDFDVAESDECGFVVADDANLGFVDPRTLLYRAVELDSTASISSLDFNPLTFRLYYSTADYSTGIRCLQVNDNFTSSSSCGTMLKNVTVLSFRVDYASDAVYVMQRHRVLVCSQSTCVPIVENSEFETMADLQLDPLNGRLFVATYAVTDNQGAFTDNQGSLRGIVSSYLLNGQLLSISPSFSLEDKVLNIACDWFGKRVYAVINRRRKSKFLIHDHDLENSVEIDLETDDVPGRSLGIELAQGLLVRLTERPFGVTIINPIWGKSFHLKILGRSWPPSNVKQMRIVYGTKRINSVLRSIWNPCVVDPCGGEICVRVNGKATCINTDTSGVPWAMILEACVAILVWIAGTGFCWSRGGRGLCCGKKGGDDSGVKFSNLQEE